MIFPRGGVMEAAVAPSGTLLGSISDFCRRTGMAESTFGRRAVNDGKFVARLRDGARVTPETLQLAVAAACAAAGRFAGEELPLLRQPAEVPPVRQHLQREGRRRAPRRP